MEAERGRQMERRRLHARRMDKRELELRRVNRADSPPPQVTAKPRRSHVIPRPASPVHGTPIRDEWLEDDADEFHTPAMAADDRDHDGDPATPQDRPLRKPIPLEADVSTPRRSGRTRQPPQWYTPPPQ